MGPDVIVRHHEENIDRFSVEYLVLNVPIWIGTASESSSTDLGHRVQRFGRQQARRNLTCDYNASFVTRNWRTPVIRRCCASQVVGQVFLGSPGIPIWYSLSFVVWYNGAASVCVFRNVKSDFSRASRITKPENLGKEIKNVETVNNFSAENNLVSRGLSGLTCIPFTQHSASAETWRYFFFSLFFFDVYYLGKGKVRNNVWRQKGPGANQKAASFETFPKCLPKLWRVSFVPGFITMQDVGK